MVATQIVGATTTWTRNVARLTGDLAALQDPTGTVEFGLARVSNPVTPDRYAWLGGKQGSTDALAGLVLMGVRLYSPGTGRFLQTDPVGGGSANAYEYCTADPINCYDLDGRFGWKKWIKGTVAVASFGACVVASAGACAIAGVAAAVLTSGPDNGWNNRRFYKGAIVGSAFTLGGAGVGKALGKVYGSVGPRGARLFKPLRRARLNRARNAVFGRNSYHWSYYKGQASLGVVGLGFQPALAD